MRGGGEGREKGGKARGQSAEGGKGGCNRCPSKKSKNLAYGRSERLKVRKVFENENFQENPEKLLIFLKNAAKVSALQSSY